MRILVALLVFASACFAANYHWHVGQNVEYYIRNSDGKAIANIHKYSGDELWWIDAPGMSDDRYETREQAEAAVEKGIGKPTKPVAQPKSDTTIHKRWVECEFKIQEFMTEYPKQYAEGAVPEVCREFSSAKSK